MGYVKHNAIVVTVKSNDEEKLLRVHKEAEKLFEGMVSPIIESQWNGYMSFFIAPDGSKEDRADFDIAHDKRKQLCDFIDSLAYEDGSNSIMFVDVAYDELHEAKVERTNAPMREDD